MRPDDFTVIYKWTEGSMPPPHYYEYEIHIGPGDNGRIIFYPDYPAKNTPVWTKEFHLNGIILDRLYQLIVERDILMRNWTETEDAAVGGELEWMQGTANKTHFMVPSTIEEYEIIESIYEYIRSIVPVQIWSKLTSQQQQYKYKYPENRG